MHIGPRTNGTQRSSSMLGSGGDSTARRTPPQLGHLRFLVSADNPTAAGTDLGWPYYLIGMHSAVHSSIGLSSKSTNAAWMLALLTPAEVARTA